MVAVLFDVWQNPGKGPVFFPELMTDAVLAMPEMQAIREALLRLHEEYDLDLDLPDAGVTLPPAVLRWVLGHEKELIDRG
jgi:hypothetical protein